MYKKIFTFIVLSFCLHLNLVTIAAADITYVLEDFESWLPRVQAGRSEAVGGVEAEDKNVRSGQRAVHLSWDLTAAHNSQNNYVRFNFQRKLLGHPTAIHAWVYVQAEQVGVPLRAWITDVSGETYIITRRIEVEGWNEVIFPLTGISPAWESGDRNRQLDLPLNFVGLAVEEQGSSGALTVDCVRVQTTGQARELLGAELLPEQRHAIGWGESPSFQLMVKNNALSRQENLAVVFSIIDVATGEQVGEERLNVGSLEKQTKKVQPFRPKVGFGVYDVHWEMFDAKGKLPGARGQLRMARMLADASLLAKGEKERAYIRHWSLLGGIFWSATHDLDRVAKTGGVWERFGNTSQWKTLELEQGHIDVSRAVAEVDRLNQAGMDLVYFNTVYNQPGFYQVDQEQFAAAYGQLHAIEAQAFGDKVGVYELGNEDNGPTKFLYTEVARHGAAGVRSENAAALIANSGTAQIDIGWLRMQASRGLFKRLDALITHPYSWSTPPEIYGTLGQLEQVNQVIDELGGMKVQLTTEWGYPETFDQLKRAQWAPRHMAIAAAAGLWRHGLYAFDNHYGIYDNGRPFPMAATLNAHVTMTHAHHFVGWLERSNSVWAAVYEKAGQPLLMAWSPSGEAVFEVSVKGQKDVRMRDMYGNIRPLPETSGDALKLKLSESPLYVGGLGQNLVRAGYAEANNRAKQRYQRLLEATSLKSLSDWPKPLSATSETAVIEALQQVLLRWEPSEAVSAPEQAIIAQALRWLSQAEHGRAALLPGGGTKRVMPNPRFAHWTQYLQESVSQDIDLPSLRWLLLQWRQLRDEQAMLTEWGELGKAGYLSRLEPIYDRVGGVLAAKGERVFFPLWAYALAPSTTTGGRHEAPIWGSTPEASTGEAKLMEHFKFTPGKPVPVRIRLHSYAQKTYEATVSLDLPPGWASTPKTWQGRVSPDISQEVIFQVTASDGAASHFETVLSVPGKPTVRVPFDDFEVLPPVEVSVPVLAAPLSKIPLPLHVANHGAESISAEIIVSAGSGLPALARAQVKNIQPEEIRNVEVELAERQPASRAHRGSLWAEVRTSNGRIFQSPLTLDYEFSPRAEVPPPLDGVLTGWEAALPLHLNKEEYARGSFGTTWSPEDLSGVVYTMWDETHFYIAARVTDQLFNQELDGASTWNQDSVQFILAAEKGPMNGFILALTPKGPQVWNERTKQLAAARLFVRPTQGEIIYEAAIPWTEFEGISPSLGQRLRFDVLFNDDDAIVNRRFLERYGIGIAHHRRIDLLGWLQLGKSLDVSAAANEEIVVFHDNFEEYQAGRSPDRWIASSHQSPVPRTVVRSGLGRENSQALELTNLLGRKPHVYYNIVRPLENLVAGHRYHLSAWVRGGVEGEGTKGLIGVCSDRLGNEGFSYVPAWNPTDQWQRVSLDFKAPGGRLNVIIRNDRQLKGLLIDAVSIRALTND